MRVLCAAAAELDVLWGAVVRPRPPCEPPRAGVTLWLPSASVGRGRRDGHGLPVAPLRPRPSDLGALAPAACAGPRGRAGSGRQAAWGGDAQARSWGTVFPVLIFQKLKSEKWFIWLNVGGLVPASVGGPSGLPTPVCGFPFLSSLGRPWSPGLSGVVRMGLLRQSGRPFLPVGPLQGPCSGRTVPTSGEHPFLSCDPTPFK